MSVEEQAHAIALELTNRVFKTELVDPAIYTTRYASIYAIVLRTLKNAGLK